MKFLVTKVNRNILNYVKNYIFSVPLAKLIFILSIILSNTIYPQIDIGSISPNFTAPVCANGDLELFDLYQQTNGSFNGGDYKVVWINLFTSW